MTDELEHLRQQVSILQQENEHLRAHLARTTGAPASSVDYQAVYRQLPLSVIIYDLEGVLLDGSDITEQIFSVAREDVIGKYNVLHNPENLDHGVPTYFARAVNGEIAQLPPVFHTMRYVEGRQDDASLWVQTTFVPIRGASDEVIYVAALESDVTERVAAEQARDELQQQLLRSKEDTIRELSTPLIPISETTVVMPLIGTIDSQRAQQIMETLLEGVAQHQAARVILDITGVVVVDTQVAQALVQAAQAVRLLGAQVMLTGIKPQIAQTLVHLGIDLSSITTYGSLQEAIVYALLQQQGSQSAGSGRGQLKQRTLDR